MRRLNLPSLESSLITFSDSCCSGPGLSGCGVDGPGPDGACAPVGCPESDGLVGCPGSGGACVPVDCAESDGDCGPLNGPGSDPDGLFDAGPD
ncbi:hypothetical protein BGY98DRAFT_966403 [Russula aff. rugulosa BPL654]|nr:hypothetical protein BGY98DRAFT_966403 [Russula aff. rugulosa BPL654]